MRDKQAVYSFDKGAIGVFDSGIGGLTVLKKLMAAFPAEPFIYFADTKNLPYGTKTPEQIYAYGRAIFKWFERQAVKMVIVACNTSSALALPLLQKEFNIPIIGTIDPLIQGLPPHYQRVGLIATPATIQSGAFEQAFQIAHPHMTLTAVACPEFVSLIEAGQINDPHTYTVVQRYLQPLQDYNIEALIYGCTHYPLLAPLISHLFSPTLSYLDPADFIVESIKNSLPCLSNTLAPPSQFYTNADPQTFSFKATHILGKNVEAVYIPLDSAL